MANTPTQPRDLTRFFRTLSDETRLRVLRLLAREELTVNELATITQLAQPRISNHLKILREEDLLAERRDGSWRHYRVEPTNLPELARTIWPSLKVAWDNDPRFQADDKRLAEVLISRHPVGNGSFFDQLANQWDTLRDVLYGENLGRVVLRSLLPPDLTVADIGTGTGYVLHLFGNRAGRLIAVDNSEAMLNVAREKARAAGLDNVEFKLADVTTAPPLEPQSADVITIIQVLHHLPDPREALANAAAGLKPGGVLIVSDFLEHQQTWLRDRLHHKWLGFTRTKTSQWFSDLRLDFSHWEVLPGRTHEWEGQRLMVPDAFIAVARLPKG
ncbi:MAG: metalloregulator ArsR/SmtB family transcription factor [Candidatus Sumerlaeia bacterium]|nr:metalloregulator ArsR/SmtB family transcription factor [Candidatus Sumerlaeia bacterium]